MSHDDKKIELLRSGHRVIVGDKWLEDHRDHPVSRDIRTARNRRRCGIHDAYVAWTRDDAVPPDLTYDSEGFAYATI